MNNKILLVFSFLFSFLSCSSDVEVEDGNSLLWKIEGNNCQTSYIYGTMHIIDEEYYDFTESMKEKVSTSEAIIMEIGGIPNPLETFSLMQLDTGDVTTLFSKEQMLVIVEFFDKKLDTSPQEFYKIYGQMKPFFIMQAISQNSFSENSKSYDLEIMTIAGDKNIPLIGLETFTQQIGFFDAISNEAMANLIIESIDGYEKEEKQMQKLMKLYAEQKVDKLIPMIKKQSPEFMEFSDVFLYDRNTAWIPKIENEIKDKKCFIAVGAAHLFGEKGVIDLLQKKGYTLTAISTEP